MNYQKQLEEVIDQNKNYRKKLLLHSCCAPCSSYVLEYLREYFDITVFFYNPKTSKSKWLYTRTTVVTIGKHRFAK